MFIYVATTHYTSDFFTFVIATSRMVYLQLGCDLLAARVHEHSYSSYEVGN